ncbi:hypothetical protein DL546_005771 [Coniochaeta pulveracea]|uniref:Cytochrome c oxidase assembly factor 3 n=1 Tax=Coniochaeta pulveracea TaxID=177199 RepID=A0A420Y7I4_9PEZI|nr:hypothetical protein DL546_005771 [Coniochaeta pulveracea]
MALNRNSYYNRNWAQSESLIRARRPYLFKNTVLGLGLLVFTGAIYTYTLKAVGQDEFEDVKVPDTPIQIGQSVIRGSKSS